MPGRPPGQRRQQRPGQCRLQREEPERAARERVRSAIQDTLPADGDEAMPMLADDEVGQEARRACLGQRAYQGSVSAATSRPPGTQATPCQSCSSRRDHSAQPNSGSAHSTTATGPLASKPMTAPSAISACARPGMWRCSDAGGSFNARHTPTITSALPSASAMSVSTAPARSRNRAEPASSAVACQATRRDCSRPCHHTSAASATPSSQCGARAANSLKPKASKPIALSQKASGGLPQNGLPSRNHGVTQSPRTAIWRAMSP
jgi:hypothetical protein